MMRLLELLHGQAGLEAEALAKACGPSTPTLQRELDALGAEPEGAVFVDDQPEYLNGAAALGIDTRYIRRGNEPWEGHHDPGDHVPITRLTALL